MVAAGRNASALLGMAATQFAGHNLYNESVPAGGIITGIGQVKGFVIILFIGKGFDPFKYDGISLNISKGEQKLEWSV